MGGWTLLCHGSRGVDDLVWECLSGHISNGMGGSMDMVNKRGGVQLRCDKCNGDWGA